jgi:hypothetical protein
MEKGESAADFWKTISETKETPHPKKLPKKTTRLVRDWARVSTLRYAGEEETFDIEVEGPFHNFVANGVIVHNCQESTRYVNYTKDAHGNGDIQFILPAGLTPAQEALFRDKYHTDQCFYNEAIRLGCTPQQARDGLPLGTKTELVMTANFREWLHFCKLRMAKPAHPKMRILATMVWKYLRVLAPDIFFVKELIELKVDTTK